MQSLVGGVGGDITDLHHATRATEGVGVGSSRLGTLSASLSHQTGKPKTYPVSTDRHVEDEVEGLLRNAGPHSRVVDLLSRNAVVLLAVHVPGHGLLAEVAVAAVELEAPGVVLVVVETRAGNETLWLPADATGVLIAVDDTEDGLLAVDVLEDIHFSAA